MHFSFFFFLKQIDSLQPQDSDQWDWVLGLETLHFNKFSEVSVPGQWGTHCFWGTHVKQQSTTEEHVGSC